MLDDGTHRDKLLNLKSGNRDSRFNREDDHDFALDPTHREFRKVGGPQADGQKFPKKRMHKSR